MHEMPIYNLKESSVAMGNILKLPICGYGDTHAHAYTQYYPFQITFLTFESKLKHQKGQK